jgi:hypothetical protein
MKGYNMKKPVKIVINNKPDPITSIKEYEIDENGKLVLVKQTIHQTKLEEVNNG